MSLRSILSAEAIKKALKNCEAPQSFYPKKFFQDCGLTSKTPKEVRDVFRIIDKDEIDESELKFFLQQFDKNARELTEAEMDNFLVLADVNGDRKINIEEFVDLVNKSK